jgi:DNA invertase Pin-like site-specific DNA recombinase
LIITQPKPKLDAPYTLANLPKKAWSQEFNSLHAQRLAAENYIASQQHEGWVLSAKHYDDGGFSGGNLERPGLHQLINDIEEGLIDCIVVYKIDRLTRSLADFSELIKVFDKHNVSFVSVTQSFNTSNSMGRLMLNVLLSFAQYERELTGERIRDKVAASKKLGMWMGGSVPLGYDVKNKKLVVNEDDATIVNFIYDMFLQNGSVTAVIKALQHKRYRTKIRITKSGKMIGGGAFDANGVRRILTNPIYTGKVHNKGKLYEGQHEAIIAEVKWQQAQDTFQEERPYNIGNRISSVPLLKGLLKCGNCGCSMSPTYTNKKGKHYRYYICHQHKQKCSQKCSVCRIAASEIEEIVKAQLLQILTKPEVIAQVISQSYDQVPESYTIKAFKNMHGIWDELFPLEQARIVKLLIDKIIISQDGIDIHIMREGLQSLATELTEDAA